MTDYDTFAENAPVVLDGDTFHIKHTGKIKN